MLEEEPYDVIEARMGRGSQMIMFLSSEKIARESDVWEGFAAILNDDILKAGVDWGCVCGLRRFFSTILLLDDATCCRPGPFARFQDYEQVAAEVPSKDGPCLHTVR